MYLQLPLQYILGQNPVSLFTLQMQTGTRKLEMKKKTTDQPQSSSTPLVIPVSFRGIFDILKNIFVGMDTSGIVLFKFDIHSRAFKGSITTVNNIKTI
jgi:hypothetical protein